MKERGILYRGLCVSLCLAFCFTCGAAFAAEAPPASAALLEAASDLDRYEIEAVFHPDSATLACVQRVWYRNRGGQPLNNLYFHAYANAFKREQTAPPTGGGEVNESLYPRGFDPGEIAFSGVKVGGRPVAFAVQGADEAVLRVPVGLLQPGEEAALEFAYTLRIPICNYRFGRGTGDIWTLGNVFPIAAMLEEGTWRLDPYIEIGDPFFSACANYTVTLEAPEGYAVASSGALRQRSAENGVQRLRFELPAARDFALVISKNYKVARDTVDGVQVLSYATTDRKAKDALAFAKDALRTLNALFAPYPYPSFTVAEVDLGDYGGMEYPGLVMIDEPQYASRDTLEYVVVHETAHQWWYAQAGNDQVREPWLDEALTEYATLLYYERVHGADRFAELIERQVEPALRVTLPGVSIGSGIDQFGSGSEYSILVYHRGAGMLHGLREAVGEETFLRILRTYLERYRFGIGTRADFIRVANEVSGSNWQGYFDDYLDTAS